MMLWDCDCQVFCFPLNLKMKCWIPIAEVQNQFTLGHALVQFMMVWHLYTEKGSLNLSKRSAVVWSRESIIHLKKNNYTVGIRLTALWLPETYSQQTFFSTVTEWSEWSIDVFYSTDTTNLFGPPKEDIFFNPINGLCLVALFDHHGYLIL